MAKNAFLTKLQIEQDQKIRLVGNTMSQWSTQIAMDALVKTLGYGDCMKKDPWGEQRILAFAKEWAANVDEIWGGLTRQPDADAIRQQTDKLIEKKSPVCTVLGSLGTSCGRIKRLRARLRIAEGFGNGKACWTMTAAHRSCCEGLPMKQNKKSSDGGNHLSEARTAATVQN